MTIRDDIYKQITIEDPLAEKLVMTKPFQRLKAINQYGGVNIVFPKKYQTSRFEHCLGVYQVLKTIGANRETQIAGLLHDVDHTAFSHMYDMALSTHTEDNHEQIMHNLEGWSEVEKLLQEYGMVIGKPDEYAMIKKSLPDIGADRFDYALRDFYSAEKETSDIPTKLLEALVTDEDGIHFNSLEAGKTFAERGNKAMWYVIYDPQVAVVYQSLIEMIRLGLENNWLTQNDFLNTDEFVFRKIMEHNSSLPNKYVKIFTTKYKVEESSQEQSDFKFIKLKSRYFDPYVETQTGKRQVSELDPQFKKDLDEYVQLFEKVKQGVYYKVTFID